MDIRHRLEGGFAILELTGSCLVSPGETELDELRSRVAQLIADGQVHVVVNLSGLASVDARGLGEFVQMLRAFTAAAGSLTFVGANARVRKMLSVTRLDSVLRLRDSEDDMFASANGFSAAGSVWSWS